MILSVVILIVGYFIREELSEMNRHLKNINENIRSK